MTEIALGLIGGLALVAASFSIGLREVADAIRESKRPKPKREPTYSVKTTKTK